MYVVWISDGLVKAGKDVLVDVFVFGFVISFFYLRQKVEFGGFSRGDVIYVVTCSYED